MRKIILNVFSLAVIIIFSVVAGMNIMILLNLGSFGESAAPLISSLIVLIIVIVVIIRGNIRKYRT